MNPVLSPQAKSFDLTFFKSRVWIMGVLNVTPDSFYAASRTPDVASAVTQASRLIEESADCIDVGGESTRPGAPAISAEEELQRVVPVIDALHARFPAVPLSLDTQKSVVAKIALSRGIRLINDISAFRHDPQLAEVVAEAKCPVVLMHMQGTPQTMQKNPQYADVVGEVLAFFAERLDVAKRAGIASDRIILDPGIGFGKTLEHNLLLLKNLSRFKSLGCPLLIGVSRKSFISRALTGSAQVLPAEARLPGTLAAQLWAIQAGANGLRVHDVMATRQSLAMWDRLDQRT